MSSTAYSVPTEPRNVLETCVLYCRTWTCSWTDQSIQGPHHARNRECFCYPAVGDNPCAYYSIVFSRSDACSSTTRWQFPCVIPLCFHSPSYPIYFTAWFLVKSLIANFARSLEPTEIEHDRRIFALTWNDEVWARSPHRLLLANTIHR